MPVVFEPAPPRDCPGRIRADSTVALASPLRNSRDFRSIVRLRRPGLVVPHPQIPDTAKTAAPLRSGYELVEHVPRPGVEEQIDNEKYEYKPRDWAAAEAIGISTLLAQLNALRREHPALQRLRGLTVHPTSNEGLLCFSRHVDAAASPTGNADTVLVILTVDPHNVREGTVSLDLGALGLPPGSTFAAQDLLSGDVYTWDDTPYVRIDPFHQVAHIISVRTA